MYEAKFNPGGGSSNICDNKDSLKDMFDVLLSQAKKGKRPGDRLRLNIDHSSLDNPVIIHLTDYRDVTSSEVMDR